MKLKRLQFYAFSLPGEGAISTRKWTRTEHFIVIATDESEMRGIGEGTPYLGRLPENLLCFNKVKRLLTGSSLSQARKKLSAAQERARKSTLFDYGAFMAVDSAIISLQSRTHPSPMHEAFGNLYHSELPAFGTIFLTSTEERNRRARRWISKGITNLKVKLTGIPRFDKNIMETVDSITNGKANIRVDANGSFRSLERAVETLSVFESMGVTQIEQPFGKANLEWTRKLRKRLDMLVFLDESAKDEYAVKRIAELGAADGIHIHPSRFGTIRCTQQMIDFIQDQGLVWSLGSSGFTGIGAFVLLLLAASQKQLHVPIEEVGHFEQFGTDIVKEPMIVENGVLTVSEGSIDTTSVDMEQFGLLARSICSPPRVFLDYGRLATKNIVRPIMVRI